MEAVRLYGFYYNDGGDILKVIFVSNNNYKIEEVIDYLSSTINIEGYKCKLEEIQSESMEAILRHKTLDAYKRIRRPVLVEHTGLTIENFGGLPGGLTQIFWDKLEAESFCDFFADKGSVKAVTMFGFCDGKSINVFRGEIEGKIVKRPRGNRKFQWDCVFEPEGSTMTFAEMGDKKRDISMRTEALKKIKTYLEVGYHV